MIARDNAREAEDEQEVHPEYTHIRLRSCLLFLPFSPLSLPHRISSASLSTCICMHTRVLFVNHLP